MATDRELFDEEYYLGLYADVRDMVRRGMMASGYDHWFYYGKEEKRLYRFNKIEVEKIIDSINPTWSNHLTLKGYKEPEPKTYSVLSVNVPDEFKPIQNIEYPEGNKIPFERYFDNKINELKPVTNRIYLPIYWTGYYVNNKYGSDKIAIDRLQGFIDALDKKLKYYTVIQYDDGILNDVKDLDIIVYSMGCKKDGYYPIPLISQPLNNNPSPEIEKKDILYSFIGADTHKLRREIVQHLGSEYVAIKSMPKEQYDGILKRSIFAICPRGYGVTSFRLYEAMAYNCIPIYISDYFWEAFNLPFTEYGIKIKSNQIKDIPNIIKSINVPEMQKKVKYYYENYIVYSSCFNSIIKTVS